MRRPVRLSEREIVILAPPFGRSIVVWETVMIWLGPKTGSAKQRRGDVTPNIFCDVPQGRI